MYSILIGGLWIRMIFGQSQDILSLGMYFFFPKITKVENRNIKKKCSIFLYYFHLYYFLVYSTLGLCV